MKKFGFILIAAILLIGLIFSGCTSTAPVTTSSAPAPASPAAPGKTEILVGAINSMTGAEAMVGGEHKWAYQKAVDDINAKGGVMVKDLGKKLPLKLIVVDDQSDVSQAAAGVEKLIKLENVDFLLGSVSTPLNVSGGAVAEKYKKLYVSTTFWPEEFQAQKLSWVVDSFFFAGKLLESSLQVLDPVPAAEKPKNVCVLVPDDPDGQGFGGGASATVPKLGFNLALYEPYTAGTKDFSASILKMKSSNVEALIILASPADGITLIRQMKESDFNVKYIWGAKGFWPVEFRDALGNDSDYVVSDGHWAEALGYPGSRELGDRFRAEFGQTKTSVTIGNFYSIVQALAMAIETAGSIDSAKVKNVFYSGTFVAKGTTNGDLKFDNTGLSAIPPVALQWYKGERKPVFPPAPDVWTVKMMPPWKQR